MPIRLSSLNVLAECRSAHLAPWSCPPFLFVMMGIVNVVAMVASWLLASRFVAEPEVAALVVIAVSAAIFTIGAFIINGFNQIAEANRIKAEFIAIVSHQLRSPLSVFKWTLDALSRLPASAPNHMDAAKGSSHLEVLRGESEKMIQLVNMLLEVSRIEAGRLLLRKEPVRLNLLTEEAVRSYAAYARASNIVLDAALPVDLPPVIGDAERTKMVIQNLIDNAIRYSPSGGHVAVSVTPNGDGVEWKIVDSGPGIPAAEQRFVFEKFFRSPGAVAAQPQGSGLGLYIARSLIAAQGGTIGFTSLAGRGATFWFRLPVYRS